jgi:hypothetical protein
MTPAPVTTATRTLRQRISGRWRRMTTEHLGRRPFRLSSGVPYISFTFDDFARSALTEGGRILEEYGVRGTYFVSMGLLGASSPSGPLATRDDLTNLIAAGHELGCHTFEHLDGTQATATDFTRSIGANREAMASVGWRPEQAVFAYPLNGPVLGIKRAVGSHFAACRGGGQTFNGGTADLNLLKACFLDRRVGTPMVEIERLIRANADASGWLIFATHDISVSPSGYGCAAEYFEHIVRLASTSGATVLPMTRAIRELCVRGQRF